MLITYLTLPRSIIIILDLEVIESLGTHDKIGEPLAVELRTNTGNTTIGGAGFYGAKTEPQEPKPPIKQAPVKQAPSQLGGGAPGNSGASRGGNSTIYPIEGLSPWAHKWTIKARVTSKSDIISWQKPGSEGKLFSVNLLDESGEIRATGFNEQCDQFYKVLQEGSVYYISNPCRITAAKKKFSNLANDWEMVFERDTVIEKAEDQTAVPKLRFNFCSLQGLEEVEKDATVDVIGVLTNVADVDQIESKARGKVYNKRELTIVDDSLCSVRATIWGQSASNFDVKPDSVIAFRGMRVGDYGGRSLSLLSSGTMHADPDIPEAHRLKGWYDATGRNENFSTHSGLSSVGSATGRPDQVKSIAQVQEQNLGIEQADYFTLKATIVYIRQENFAYPACRSPGCNKKVEENAGAWRCEKCDVSHPSPEYRYIISISVADHTGQMYLNCFDDVGRIIMGKPAGDLMELREVGDDAALVAEFEAANCRELSFRVRATMDTYNGIERYVNVYALVCFSLFVSLCVSFPFPSPFPSHLTYISACPFFVNIDSVTTELDDTDVSSRRVRYQTMSASPLDYKSEAQRLAELIKEMSV